MTTNPFRPTASALSLLTAILLGGFAGDPAGQAAVVRVGSELAFPPYASVDQDGRAVGFSVDLIQAVAETMGLQVEMSTGTWDSVWNRLLTDRLDVLPLVAKSPERTRSVDFSLPHTVTYDAFFVRPGTPALESLQAARGKEIVVMRSDAAHQALVERNFQGRIILVDMIPEGLALVASGRHDAFLCPKLIGSLSLRDLGGPGLVVGPPIPDYKRTFCFAVKRGDSELLEKLNQGLLIIKANGEYQRIYDRWLSAEDPWNKWKRYLALMASVFLAVFLAGAVWLRTLRRLVQRATQALAQKNEQLRQIQDGLETTATERTADLQLANTRLQAEIAEHERTELKLRVSHERLELAQSAAGAGLWDWNITVGTIEWDSRLFDLFGLDQGKVSASFANWRQIVHPEDLAVAEAQIAQALRDQVELVNIYRIVLSDGKIRWIQSTGRGIYGANGQPHRMSGLCVDITKAKQAEEDIKRSREDFQGYFEMGSLGMCVTSVEKGWLAVNERLCQMLGYTKAELSKFAWAELTHPDDLGVDLQFFEEVMAGKRERYELDKRFIRKDGSVVYTTLSVACQRKPDGTVNHFLASLLDITERKQAEAALQSALREKIGLLNEVHHRVKNNLQVITSLLRLEAGRNEHPAAQSALKEMGARVMAMALLHESLYRSGVFGVVDLGAYLRELTDRAFRAQALRPGSIRLHQELESILVGFDQAMPCGLLVNELLCNSLKHGFPDGGNGEVRIELQLVDGGPQVRLRVSNTGVGLPADFESKQGHSLGLQLVASLVRQLEGRWTVGPAPAVVFDVFFTPKPTPPKFSSPAP